MIYTTNGIAALCSLFILAASLCGCSQRAPALEMKVEILDILPVAQAHPVRVRDGALLHGVSSNELAMICSAIGRTPIIHYVIVSVETFPREEATTARVEVPDNLLVLLKTERNEWHVIKMMSFHR